MIYSVHDTEIANMVEFVSPIDYYYNKVHFSSTLIFELWYDPDCVDLGGE